MLKYLVQVTADLMAAGLIIGMLLAYMGVSFPKGRRVMWVATGVGLLAAVGMALAVNTSNALSKRLNLGYIAYIDLVTFAIFGAAFALFLLFCIPVIRRNTRTVGVVITYAAAGLMVVSLLFYCLPAVIAYPYNFDVASNNIMSTDFIYRFIGWIAGLLVVLIASLAMAKIESSLRSPWKHGFLIGMIGVLALRYAGIAIQLMLSRRMIQQTHFLFSVVKITVNYSEWFLIAIMLIALAAAIFLFASNLRIAEPYENAAQCRKIKAGMRRWRRWSLTLMACVLLATLNVTAIDAYNNKEPDEAPTEEVEIVGDQVVVPLTAVDDGHLHRFGYTTEDGILVKFIVVQKPNSSAYGVGLDACEICGDAGYYERDTQIVCRRCDVVMNKNTIGFKGGCNPIVMDYTVENGQIIVPIQTLVDHQDEFK